MDCQRNGLRRLAAALMCHAVQLVVAQRVGRVFAERRGAHPLQSHLPVIEHLPEGRLAGLIAHQPLRVLHL